VVSTVEAGQPRAAAQRRRRKDRKVYALDVARYCATSQGGGPSVGRRLKLWIMNRDFRAVACFRFAQATRRLYGKSRPVGLLPVVVGALWRRRVAHSYHVTIDRRAQIGPGFYIMHGFGVFLGPVTIGANCVLHQNVTIGQRVAGGEQGVPRLGHNVWIGPGSTISGDITIGNDVTISAGTVLSKSVPDGCLVAGNPGRVIQQNYDNGSIMNYVVARPPETQVKPNEA
jgi:serine acetyltransferase